MSHALLILWQKYYVNTIRLKVAVNNTLKENTNKNSTTDISHQFYNEQFE